MLNKNSNKESYKCDFHIHSCLSPCADILMTPGNIIKQALEVGLDVIAITDHNTAGNVEVALKLVSDTDLIIIPGMEVESIEEVHLLCFFDSLEQLKKWDKIVDQALPDMENDEEGFGYQLLTDESDEYIAKESKLLATATSLSVNEIVEIVNSLDGIVIPSHLDRPYNSLIGQLGFVPPELKISAIELSKNADPKKFFAKYPNLMDYSYIVSSDSHYLKDIKAMVEIELLKECRKHRSEGINELEGYPVKYSAIRCSDVLLSLIKRAII